MTLTEIISEATCECGHGILSDHVNKCNWKSIEGDDPTHRLRQVIWGPECPCEKSDAKALALVFKSLLADQAARVKAVLRLINPEHITPIGVRQISAVLAEVEQGR